MEVLVIDVGGSSVKLWHSGHQEHRRFESGKEFTPELLVENTLRQLEDWTYEAIALGLPCRVTHGRPIEDPINLGPGWVAFNYTAALGKPVRIMNDACLQALAMPFVLRPKRVVKPLQDLVVADSSRIAIAVREGLGNANQ